MNKGQLRGAATPYITYINDGGTPVVFSHGKEDLAKGNATIGYAEYIYRAVLCVRDDKQCASLD